MEKFRENSQDNQVLKYLQNLEKRISRIEEHLNIRSEQSEIEYEQKISQPISKVAESTVESSDALEFKIGQFWFAKAGIVVLAIGIVLALTFPYKNFPPMLPSLIGFIFVLGILGLSHLFRNSFSLISRYLFGGALLLLYFTTLRLSFFGLEPVIANKLILIPLLLFVVALFLFMAVKRESIYLSGIALLLGFITALVSEQAFSVFFLIALFAGISVYLRSKFQWPKILVLGIILALLTHFFWFVNNPFLGHSLELVTTLETNLLFVLFYSLIFVTGNLFRNRELPKDNTDNVISFLNSFGSFALFFLIAVTAYQNHIAVYHFIAAVVFIGLSILFWVKEKSRYSSFFYSIIGYSALSVAIITQFPKPDFFIWLCWQSLIVISTAIWFRSKIIVLANFIIYIIILIAYLVTAGRADLISLSFVAVSMVSARIMNWQKDRLELKTEYMRNAYLTTAFLIFPYALYNVVPTSYVAFAWVGIAFFYYGLSIILKNKKYRLMALFTLLVTVGYIFIIGTLKLEPIFRIFSFLVLGIVLLIVSLLYTRLRNKSVIHENSS